MDKAYLDESLIVLKTICCFLDLDVLKKRLSLFLLMATLWQIPLQLSNTSGPEGNQYLLEKEQRVLPTR
jgi:hypothetical protein